MPKRHSKRVRRRLHRRAEKAAKERHQERKHNYFLDFYAEIVPVLLGFPQQVQKELDYIETGKPFQILPVVVIKIIMLYIEDLQLKEENYIRRTLHFKEYVNMDIRSYKKYGVLRPSDLRFMTNFFGKRVMRSKIKHYEKPTHNCNDVTSG